MTNEGYGWTHKEKEGHQKEWIAQEEYKKRIKEEEGES